MLDDDTKKRLKEIQDSINRYKNKPSTQGVASRPFYLKDLELLLRTPVKRLIYFHRKSFRDLPKRRPKSSYFKLHTRPKEPWFSDCLSMIFGVFLR